MSSAPNILRGIASHIGIASHLPARLAAEFRLCWSSVAAELFYADVVAVHTGVGEHRLKISDHLRRTRNVVNRPCRIPVRGSHCLQMSIQHLIIDQADFPLPGMSRFLSFSHRSDESIVVVLLLESL